jgi:hypothetical protein
VKRKRGSQAEIDGPGYTVKRHGRHMQIETHRTPEEFAEMQRHAVASKPELLKSIKAAGDELMTLINKYSSFDLVAHLWLRNGLFDGDTYVESESQSRPHFIEYAALTELKNLQYRLKLPAAVDTARCRSRAKPD